MRIVYETGRVGVASPAIFIDRDGVINLRRPDDYVLEWSQFVFTPGIRKALKDLSTLRLPMAVISNQAAVGKGLLKPSELEAITSRMHEILLADGTTIAAYYYCIHKSDDHCDCRKPRPGLLLDSASDLNIDLSRSIFVGDSESDVQAARSAGCEPILFDCGGARLLNPTNGTPEGVAVACTAEELYPVALNCLAARGDKLH
jgi:D-glycero-D-manno-heptose 1,7-bisphosphate phosphatase